MTEPKDIPNEEPGEEPKATDAEAVAAAWTVGKNATIDAIVGGRLRPEQIQKLDEPSVAALFGLKADKNGNMPSWWDWEATREKLASIFVTCGNWSWREPELQDGDVVTGGNFSQERPGTVICKDVKDQTILGGNFTNCVAQPTWIVKGGNWNQVDLAALDAAEAAEKAAKATALEADRVKVADALNAPLATATKDMTAVVKDGQIVVVKTGEVPK